jgi:hypothetical protein
MRLDDEVVADSLDDTWRTVPEVKRLLLESRPAEEVSAALRRLARAGKIEKREHSTKVPKYRTTAPARVFKIEYYRRLSPGGPYRVGPSS